MHGTGAKDSIDKAHTRRRRRRGRRNGGEGKQAHHKRIGNEWQGTTGLRGVGVGVEGRLERTRYDTYSH